MTTVNTFSTLLTWSAAQYPNRDAFRIRQEKHYKSISYTQLQSDTLNIAAAGTSVGIPTKKCAILGENSYEWVISYLGTAISGAVVVPIDKELTAKEIDNILQQADISYLFCSEDYLDVAEELTIPIEIITLTAEPMGTYKSLAQLIELGAELRKQNPNLGQNEKTTDTLSTIVFTSGTTGFSKGVMLSRNNIFANIHSADKLIKLSGSTLSLLPMNHTYEFTLDILLTIYQGVTVAINNGIKNFQQNLQIFQPTTLIIVPLVAENLMKSIQTKIDNENKTKKVQTALKLSRTLLKLGIDIRHKLFAPIHQALGGKLESLFVGGAFLDPKIARQFHDFGFRVNIGYGITECAPLVTGNITNNPNTFASCGVQIPDVSIQILEPNENGEGEILTTGPNVMMGYYNNPQATDKVLKNNWFYTGDIGRIDNQGMLFITGRVKNLIVLNNGKNVYPEELESLIIQANTAVKEVVVTAQSTAPGQEVNIQAEIFPDPESNLALEQLQQQITESIEQLNEKLPYFKRIVDVKFRTSEFPKTTTKKIKRY